MQIGNQPVTSAAILAGLAGQTISAGASNIGGIGLGFSSTGSIILNSSGAYSWGSGSFGAPDLFLVRDGANTLAQRAGTSSQEFRLYETYTDALNYSRLTLRYNSLAFEIVNQAAGTGTSRAVRLMGGASALTVDPVSGTTTILRGGGSAASLFEVTSGGSGMTSSALKFAKLTATIQGSGGAGYTIFDIDVTETSVGSGLKRLINAQVGGVSLFSVDNTGAILANSINARLRLPAMALASQGTASGQGNGALRYVTDLTSTTRGATATGGGALPGLVVSDGANWIIV
ncbi:MAG: hypothetical protein HYX38_35200 [Rhodospirillales bacterium]|nr:hypothetical protein [Rhodospirillales bacterium]